jgi:4-hydroxy-4-methyl-2-oxoglutarate aldolase
LAGNILKENIKNKHEISTLLNFGSATTYEAQGAKGALDCGIKPIHPAMRVAGPAFTVDICPADNLMLHYALLHIKPGDVLVVDAKSYIDAGPWGDVLTEQALKKGVAGLVINGAVRDAKAIIEMNFPVFCLALSIKGTTKNQPGLLNQTICFDNVVINPGDLIVADQDGVVVVPQHQISEVASKAADRENKEAEYRENIRNGENTVDLLGLSSTLKRLNFDV